ncbi:MAG: sodium/proton-translocating pyrophosphatase, partial [Thermoplasmatota archaeon]
MNVDIWTWTIPIGGLIALLFATLLYIKVKNQETGNEKMRELTKAIRDGAMAFLNSEYKVLMVFVAIVAILLFIASFIEGSNIEIGLPIAFIIGAIFSALSGNIGMRMATMANGRTAEGTKHSLGKGLSIAFSSGAVMGMIVVGLGVLGVFTLFFMFTQFFSFNVVTATNMLFGFGFGASSIALFARVGGGIYTKAADVGADLVGKIEEGIPEDDPRNPAVIADQVGDNVGDVAGMGADLFESYVDSLIATMALAAVSMATILKNGGTDPLGQLILNAGNMEAAVWLPLVLAALGILSSIAGILLVVMGKGKNIYGALRNSLYLAAALTAVLTGLATWFMLGDLNPFYAILSGLAAGLIIGYSTEYYTSEKQKPAQSIADASKTGPATVIIQGLQVGMMSTIIPVIAVVAAMLAAYYFADFYGVAISA